MLDFSYHDRLRQCGFDPAEFGIKYGWRNVGDFRASGRFGRSGASLGVANLIKCRKKFFPEMVAEAGGGELLRRLGVIESEVSKQAAGG